MDSVFLNLTVLCYVIVHPCHTLCSVIIIFVSYKWFHCLDYYIYMLQMVRNIEKQLGTAIWLGVEILGTAIWLGVEILRCNIWCRNIGNLWCGNIGKQLGNA